VTGVMHAWIDATAGIAGDMLLGALTDAGAELGPIQQAVDAVIPGSVTLLKSEVTRAGQRATKVDVRVNVAQHHHRRWPDIRDMLTAASPLADAVRDLALSVFTALAEAEARVHGIPADRVHFHEVGALDSIADIVGVCAALDQLRIDSISASPVSVGSGRTHADHGDLPIPVPAVLQLAMGWQVQAGGIGELTTPTGMALVAVLADNCETLPPLTIRRSGAGAGSKDITGRPNITRVIIGEPHAAAHDHAQETALLLEANIDDLDPRLWPGILNRILDAGAVDAWLTPILMKKGRPAHTLGVLARHQHAPMLRDVMFSETTTIGVRETTVNRTALPRAWVGLLIDGHQVAVKIAHRDGVIVRVTPEFDEVAALAGLRNRPTKDVLDEVAATAAARGLIVGGVVPPAARSSRAHPIERTTPR